MGSIWKVDIHQMHLAKCTKMPQILNGFDIKYNTFKRGFGEKHYPKNEFYWKSPDGSIVFNVYLDRYGNFGVFQIRTNH